MTKTYMEDKTLKCGYTLVDLDVNIAVWYNIDNILSER